MAKIINIPGIGDYKVPDDVTGEEIQQIRSFTAGRMREDLAKEPSLENQISQRRTEIGRKEAPIMSQMFPRTVERAAQGQEGFGGNLAASVSDIVSGTGRTIVGATKAVGAIMDGKDAEEVGRAYMQSLRESEGDGFLESIAKDPRTAAGIVLAPVLAPLAASGFGGSVLAGLTEGLVTGVTGQIEHVGSSEDLSWKEFGIDVGLSTVLPIVGAGLKKGGTKALETLQPLSNKMSERFKGWASSLTGLSEEAIELGQTKGGRQKALAMSGKMNEVAEDLIAKIDDKDLILPYENQVVEVLENLPTMNPQPIINSLNKSLKSLGNSPSDVLAAKQIKARMNGLVKDYTSETTESIGFKTNTLSGMPEEAFETISSIKEIPAVDYRNLRIDLDKEGIFDLGASGAKNIYKKAMIKARTVAKEALEDSAKKSGHPQYEEVMKKYSKALEVKKEIASKFGKIEDKMDTRVSSFFRTMQEGSRSKELLKQFDEIFGENFSKKTKLIKLSDELVKGGKIPFFPTQFTGRSTLGPGMATKFASNISDVATRPIESAAKAALAVGTGGLSSPQIAPRMVQGLQSFGQGAAPEIGQSILSNPLLQRTIPLLARQPLQQGLGGQQ